MAQSVISDDRLRRSLSLEDPHEECRIEALDANCRSGRKVKLPLSSLVAANTPLVSLPEIL